MERTNPLRARYVRILTHAASAGGTERSTPPDAPALLLEVARQGIPHAPQPWYPALFSHARQLAVCLAGESGAARSAETEDDSLSEPQTASQGARYCTRVWSMLATDSDQSGRFFKALFEKQQPSGAFFAFNGNAGDNPEPWWYHELVMLHAVTSYAMLTGDATALAASHKAAAFHHAETQPDHATNQPWAIHAFIADPEFTPTADLMLLAAGVQQPDGLGAISRILLADAAVCLSIA